MKKHLLIGIPVILLHILSLSAVIYGINAIKNYDYLNHVLETTTEVDNLKFINSIEKMEDKDKALIYAVKLLRSSEENKEFRNNYTLKVISDSKNYFFELTVFASISTLLSFLLIIGLAPMFKKVSNKAVELDAKKDSRHSL